MTKQEIEIIKAINKAPHLTSYILKLFDNETVKHVIEYLKQKK